ncbi:T9SS type A sorting domain-containing protein [Owenweeksia hongkongensis]|uniref:T9SS type A sorting domain-containing protein n=1 Tax=Owenweeksia hongkongensis TaxID=253245 RepID=UPI003A8F96D4
MLRILSSFLFFCLALNLLGQTPNSRKSYTITKSHTFVPKEAKPDFNAQLKNIEAPSPDGDSYRSFLMRQKIKSREMFPRKQAPANNKKTQSTAPQPQVGPGYNITFQPPIGPEREYSGGIPNDNTMAISNNGKLVAAINSTVWAYDIEADSTLFKPFNLLSLNQIAQGNITGRYFDPKMVYDEKADRFILVFLKDSEPSSSRIVVAFSSSNNPIDPWYVYELPGNPLNNNRWTDFPAISLTENELFITGNLIVPNVTWQVGFDGSVIWQLDKSAGYNNDSILPNKLYSQVQFNNKFTRNIHPVQNINQDGDRQYFLSNRNFDVTNDTIFVMYIDGTLDDPTTQLTVEMGKTTPNYGVPPNGRQQDTDLNDPTKGLQTNDGRVLGAITNGDWIQFVSNSINPATGFSSIYHGMITNPATPQRKISGTIIADPVLDFGYPNIAFAGNEDCDVESIIGFDFASPTDFPGVGAVYFANDSTHSTLVRLKEGGNYVDKHSDSYERWGDYFGIQKRHNNPGEVWVAGFYGLANTGSGTWINRLNSPDSAKVVSAPEISGDPVFCSGRLNIKVSGGVAPYSFNFNNDITSASYADSLCDGDTINYLVTDARGCSSEGTYIVPKIQSGNANGIYPNPFSGNVVAQFNLPSDQRVSAYIYDMQGSMVAKIIDQNGTAGLNEIVFNLSPLRVGQYVLRVYANDEELLTEKMIKNE